MTISDEGWTDALLPELDIFSIDWSQTQTTKKTSKDGGSYDGRKIVVSCAKYTNTFAVNITARTYRALRLINLSGAGKYRATFGLKAKESDRYAPILFSGVA